jgi:hypothetical protein
MSLLLSLAYSCTNLQPLSPHQYRPWVLAARAVMVTTLALAMLEAIRTGNIPVTCHRHGYLSRFMEVSALATRPRKPYLTDLTALPWAILPALIPLAKPTGRCVKRGESESLDAAPTMLDNKVISDGCISAHFRRRPLPRSSR